MNMDQLRVEIERVFERLSRNELTDLDTIDSTALAVETPPSQVREHFKAGKVTEPDAVVFSHFTPRMGVILDVGAHWGYMASSIRLSGTKCKVISVEPMSVHKRSLAALKRLDSGNYDFRMTAVSDSERALVLYGPVVNGQPIYGLNSANGAIFQPWYVDFLVSMAGSQIALAEHYTFQLLVTRLNCTTVDKLVQKGKFAFDASRVAAIKIDVEGHEAQVLNGANKVITSQRPFIMVEGANRVPNVVEYLTAKGYISAHRDGKVIVEDSGMSMDPNGYWFHHSRAEQYRKMGLLV